MRNTLTRGPYLSHTGTFCFTPTRTHSLWNTRHTRTGIPHGYLLSLSSFFLSRSQSWNTHSLTRIIHTHTNEHQQAWETFLGLFLSLLDTHSFAHTFSRTRQGDTKYVWNQNNPLESSSSLKGQHKSLKIKLFFSKTDKLETWDFKQQFLIRRFSQTDHQDRINHVHQIMNGRLFTTSELDMTTVSTFNV